jgi:hypothetical protein
MTQEQEKPKSREPITCHKSAPRLAAFADMPIEWTIKQHGQSPDPCDHCSYCGSVHFDDIRRIVAEGGKLGGSDWKYGHPHKFYVYSKNNDDMYKFYTIHLLDLPREEFDEFAALLKEQTGIEFAWRDEELMYRAPYHGYQR